MNIKKEKTNYGLGCLILFIPFLIIINIICVLMIRNELKIIRSDFHKGIIYIDSIECNSVSGSDGDNELCYGFGSVEGVLTKVKLGNENKIDLTKKNYSVFYRPDGKLTILNKSESNYLDKKKYKRETFLIMIFIILFNIIFGITFLKLKKIKNESKI